MTQSQVCHQWCCIKCHSEERNDEESVPDLVETDSSRSLSWA